MPLSCKQVGNEWVCKEPHGGEYKGATREEAISKAKAGWQEKYKAGHKTGKEREGKADAKEEECQCNGDCNGNCDCDCAECD